MIYLLIPLYFVEESLLRFFDGLLIFLINYLLLIKVLSLMLYDENENLDHLSPALLLLWLFDGYLIFLLGYPLLVTPVLSLL